MLDEIIKSNSKDDMKTDEIIRDYRILFCRDPQPEEMALEAGITPEKAKEVLEELAISKRWHQPTEIDKQKAQEKARKRLIAFGSLTTSMLLPFSLIRAIFKSDFPSFEMHRTFSWQ